jgi:hypothetical protein
LYPNAQIMFTLIVRIVAAAMRDDDGTNRQPSLRQRSRLVEHDGVHGAGGLQRPVALEEDP